MSSFTSDLVVKKIGKRKWELFTPFEYHVGNEDSLEVIVVPVGFKTDFASIPQPFWSLLPPDGAYTGAAVVHDFLYATHKIDGKRTRKRCDQIFLEAMEVLDVPKWKRKIMYRAVRMFGWIGWNKKRK